MKKLYKTVINIIMHAYTAVQYSDKCNATETYNHPLTLGNKRENK